MLVTLKDLQGETSSPSVLHIVKLPLNLKRTQCYKVCYIVLTIFCTLKKFMQVTLRDLQGKMYHRNMSVKLKKVVFFMWLSIIIIWDLFFFYRSFTWTSITWCALQSVIHSVDHITELLPVVINQLWCFLLERFFVLLDISLLPFCTERSQKS